MVMVSDIRWELGAFWLLVVTLSNAQVPGDSTSTSSPIPTSPMSPEEIDDLKLEAKDMFYHAYNAYMENAYPADELMPLSCKGRYRDPANSRGDLDDTLGNFSLTLIDTLDTLVILGDLEEFDRAVRLVVEDVSFDQDVVVSVFETNIRVLGGLLSAHILAEYLQTRADMMLWYHAELLTMAKDLGYRLLPAFNTTTGIPYSRINLRHGMKPLRLAAHTETCTSCAGTMVLEMAALSRLTGDPVFEEKAHRAMDELWRLRHRATDLMGNVLNVHSGDWVRRDSGVGAGIDSYYEYCLKAYILLGDEQYLTRFTRHYSAIMKYISQGPLLVDVHMHRPNTNSKNFMDALLAFWPGLQVLMGDIAPAVATHEMLYQVMLRHNLIPEAFTTDFQVHWAQHPLRPEFVESTYFLYKATNDPYYLEVGKAALKSLQKHARVPCGYATIKDVRTGGHDDRMDSFVLAETFKYLYLLFAKPSEIILDLDEFVFTTEAHLLPLSLARGYNHSRATSFSDDVDVLDSEMARTCPNTLNLFPESVRLPLKNMVDGICPRRTSRRKLFAAQFSSGNPEHLQLLKNMGISVLSLSDGRVHLLHSASTARSNADAEEGLVFMQEMVELSQAQKQLPERPPVTVAFKHIGQQFSITAGRAQFGRDLVSGMKVTARLSLAEPLRACEPLSNPDRLKGRIVVIERGDCIFVSKVRRAEEAGAIAVIVVDNTPGSSSVTSSMFAMSGDGNDDVTIPAVFLFYQDASQLLKAIVENPGLEVTVADHQQIEAGQLTPDLADSLMGRLRGSFEELLGGKTPLTPGGATERVAASKSPSLDKEIPRPEGPKPKVDMRSLEKYFEEMVKRNAKSPVKLGILYEKLQKDAQSPAALEKLGKQQPAAAVYSVLNVYKSQEPGSDGWIDDDDDIESSSAESEEQELRARLLTTRQDGTFFQAYTDLKSILATVDHLVAVMLNDSEVTSSTEGVQVIKRQQDFIQMLNILLTHFQTYFSQEVPQVHSVTTDDDVLIIARSETEFRIVNDTTRSKDEL